MTGRGFTIQLKASPQGTAHLHQGLECFLVLRGEVELLTGSVTRRLREDELAVVFRNQLHAITSSPGSLVLVLAVEEETMRSLCGPIAESHTPNDSCDMIASSSHQSGFEMRRILVQMFALTMEKPFAVDLALTMHLARFLFLLYTSCPTKPRGDEVSALTDITRGTRQAQIAEILAYLDRHHAEPLTLSDIAARFYLSPSYFSRYFRQATGESYLRYLQTLRVEKSIPQLIYGGASLSDVARASGFRSTRSYADSFLKRYGVSPSVYRKDHGDTRPQRSHAETSSDVPSLLAGDADADLRIEFLRYMGRYDTGTAVFGEHTTLAEIAVHRGATSARELPDLEIRALDVILLIDRVESALRADFAASAQMMRRIGARYAYFTLLDARQSRQGLSPGQLGDMMAAIESIESVGLIPFIRIECFDFAQTVLRSVLEALSVRFSSRHCATWRFELVCTAGGDSLYASYRDAHALLCGFFPHSAIGMFVDMEEERAVVPRSEQLAAEAVRRGIPPAFVTFHSFQNRVKARYPQDAANFEADADYHRISAQVVRAMLRRTGLQVPLYLTAWNTLSGENRSEIGMFTRMAIILDSLLRIEHSVAGVGYRFTAGVPCPYSGEQSGASLDLMVLSGGRRPAYFVAEFYQRMVGRVLYRSSQLCSVINRDDELVVTIRNPQWLNPAKAIDGALTASLALHYRITLTGLAIRSYCMKRFSVDGVNCGTHSQFRRAGFPDWRDRDVADYMSASVGSDLVVLNEEARDGKLILSGDIPYNGIVMYVIRLS